MEYRELGRTGVRVTPLCLGAMNWNAEDETGDEGVRCIQSALDRGINFIDTANIYSRGGSELVVGKALAGRRDDVVIATKVHGHMGEGPNDWGNSRRHVITQCDASLRRLGTDWIDLYQLHRPDPTTPIEETLLALHDLVTQGKIRYVGFSAFAAWQTMEALAIADRRNLHSAPVCEQPPYNMLDRRVEADVIPLALKYGVGIIPWSPLASGILTGKYADGVPEGSRLSHYPGAREEPKVLAALAATQRLADLARDAGLTMVALALGWLMRQPGVTAPIIGPKTLAQLDDNLAALDAQLDDDVITAIDEIVPPRTAIYPLT